MLSHLCLGTNDFPRAYAFYTALLGELGLIEKFHDPAQPWAGWMAQQAPRPLFVLALGAVCEGPPGLRPQYHANYYGAYFRDLDGNKLCVCCHAEE